MPRIAVAVCRIDLDRWNSTSLSFITVNTSGGGAAGSVLFTILLARDLAAGEIEVIA